MKSIISLLLLVIAWTTLQAQPVLRFGITNEYSDFITTGEAGGGTFVNSRSPFQVYPWRGGRLIGLKIEVANVGDDDWYSFNTPMTIADWPFQPAMALGAFVYCALVDADTNVVVSASLNLLSVANWYPIRGGTNDNPTPFIGPFVQGGQWGVAHQWAMAEPLVFIWFPPGTPDGDYLWVMDLNPVQIPWWQGVKDRIQCPVHLEGFSMALTGTPERVDLEFLP